jgi:hypothetical protein
MHIAVIVVLVVVVIAVAAYVMWSKEVIVPESVGVVMFLNWNRPGQSITFTGGTTGLVASGEFTLTCTPAAGGQPSTYATLGTYNNDKGFFWNPAYEGGWSTWFMPSGGYSAVAGDTIEITGIVTTSSGKKQKVDVKFVLKEVGNSITVYGACPIQVCPVGRP